MVRSVIIFSKKSLPMKKSNVQSRIAVASFVAAIAFSIAGFIVPPLGDLTEANLYLVAQFLLVTTSLFGVSAIVSRSLISKFNHHERQDTPEGVEE